MAYYNKYDQYKFRQIMSRLSVTNEFKNEKRLEIINFISSMKKNYASAYL